jgi:hypothetical protein
VSDSFGSSGAAAGQVVDRAADAYLALVELAETVEDEWQYVTDLSDAYLPSIRALAAAHPGESLAPEAVAAVDEAIAEIELITDPHKAIDWLSTFPHLVGLAFGGDVDRPAGDDSIGGADDNAEPDDDSPFRLLLRRDK